nr:hypothetical protein [Streptomyces sp. CB03234]
MHVFDDYLFGPAAEGRLQRGRRLSIPIGDHEQHGCPRRPAQQTAEQFDGGRVGGVVVVKNENQPGCAELFEESAYGAEAGPRHGLHGVCRTFSVAVPDQPKSDSQLLALRRRKSLHGRAHEVVLVIECVGEKAEWCGTLLVIHPAGEDAGVPGTRDGGELPQHRTLANAWVARYFDKPGNWLAPCYLA